MSTDHSVLHIPDDSRSGRAIPLPSVGAGEQNKLHANSSYKYTQCCWVWRNRRCPPPGAQWRRRQKVRKSLKNNRALEEMKQCVKSLSDLIEMCAAVL